jgi:crotonobetainyl-CoA:carnitine CoA-transferase CaiB-like acyl-CoA transferase
MQDKHLRERGMFAEIDHASRGKLTMPGWPVKMSDSKVPVRAAPLLGEQTAEVLAEWLAMNPQEIADYQKQNQAAS